MRILMVSREYPPYPGGGMGIVVKELAELFCKMNLKLTVIAPSSANALFKETLNGVEIYRVPLFGSSFITKIPVFSKRASGLVSSLQGDYDIIYSHAVPLFCRLKKPLVAHFHGTRYGEYLACKALGKPLYALANKFYIPFDSRLAQSAGGIIALSAEMSGHIKIFAPKAKNITVIPNGVDLDIFKPSLPRLFTAEPKRILYVGRLDARKRVDLLLDAAAKVSRNVKIKVVIAGDGNQKRFLMNRAQSLGLDVDFMGKVDYAILPRVYNNADIFVLPSIYEGFPLAPLEAIACGTPAIVSDACPDIGVLRFDKNSSDSLVAVIRDNISSEEKLLSLSQKGIESSKGYAWDRVAVRIKDFLENLLGGGHL